MFLNSSLETLQISRVRHGAVESLYRSPGRAEMIGVAGLRNDVERWMIHGGLPFTDVRNSKETFHIRIRQAGKHGMPVEVFEPKAQPGILVVGANVLMKNNQIARYRGFSEKEKEMWLARVAEYCNAIRAVHRIISEDGKEKIGVYVVLDDKENINQQTILDAIDNVSEMHYKTSKFLLKTF